MRARRPGQRADKGCQKHRSSGFMDGARPAAMEVLMANLGFSVFDCDNHYYEALDAFTRHIEPAYAKRAMQWATVNGKQRLLVGGKINRFIPNPTFDPVSKPGRAGRVLPRPQPQRLGPGQAVRRAGPDLARVPRPGRPAGADGRAGPRRRDLPRPRSASAWRCRSTTTCRRCWRRSARSTGGWTRTGGSRTRSGSSPRPTSRWSTPTARSASWSGRCRRTRASSSWSVARC